MQHIGLLAVCTPWGFLVCLLAGPAFSGAPAALQGSGCAAFTALPA